MPLENFRSYQLAKELYRECDSLSFTGEMRDQFKRAMLSVVLNLAEGSGKPTLRDRRKFYATALGSTREVQAILDLNNLSSLRQRADILGAMIYRLMQNPGGG